MNANIEEVYVDVYTEQNATDVETTETTVNRPKNRREMKCLMSQFLEDVVRASIDIARNNKRTRVNGEDVKKAIHMFKFKPYRVCKF